MKQILILFLTLTLLFPTYVIAQEIPKVTDIQKGQAAPFSGTLLNPTAAAQIIVEKENLKSECKLRYDYIKCDLLLGNANTSLRAADMKYETILSIKNDEIERLQDIALERPNDNSIWWYAGGILTGILVSVGVFYAAIEVQR